MTTTKLSDLAAKYVRQIASVGDLRRAADLANTNAEHEQRALDSTATELKELVGNARSHVLIPLGYGQHVLVHVAGGSFGRYTAIDIVEESK